MANLTPEQEWQDRNGIKRGGGYIFVGNSKAELYNALHGTNVFDDKALERLLENESPKRHC